MMRRFITTTFKRQPLSGHLALSSLRFSTSICSGISESPQHEIFPNLFSVLEQPDWEKNPSLKTLKRTISSPFRLSNFLSEYPNLNPHTALKFFNFLSAGDQSFKPNVQAYASLLNILIHNKLFDDAVKPQIKMFDACEKTEDAKFVLEFLRKMGCLGGDNDCNDFKLSVACYNRLLYTLSRFDLIDDMEYVYDMMVRDSVSPDIDTFNLMIYGYCIFGHVDKAEMFLGKILEAGLMPDTRTYTYLVEGYCNRKDVDGAMRVFTTMDDKGCPRDASTYSSLIYGLCREGQLDDAVKLLSSMEENGVIPDGSTYAPLIHSLCRRGRVEEAHVMFNSLDEKGIKASKEMYVSLTAGYIAESRFSIVKTLKDRMTAEGFWVSKDDDKLVEA